MCLSPASACRTLYEKLGGEAAVEAAVSVFYGKIMADPLLVPFFEGVDMKKQARKQVGAVSVLPYAESRGGYCWWWRQGGPRTCQGCFAAGAVAYLPSAMPRAAGSPFQHLCFAEQT
jgi:hypothetical protein